MISQGSYSVVRSEGELIEIELYNISGSVFTYNNLPAVFSIEIDSSANTIRINDRLFERVE